MKLVVFALVVALVACSKDVKPRCERLVEMERYCNQMRPDTEDLWMAGCRLSLEEGPRNGDDMAHRVTCAESTRTCEEYETCTLRFYTRQP